MRNALIISLIFHTVVIASSIIGLPVLSRQRPTVMKVIPIEMVKIADVTRLKSQQKKSPKVTKKTKLRKKILTRKVEMPPAPPKLASNMPVPDIKSKPQIKKKSVKKRVIKTAVSRVEKITPGNKPSRFNIGRLAALLDKREQSEPDIIKKMKNREFTGEKRISTVDIRQQTLKIADAVNKYIYDNNCWNVPAGAKGAEGLKVTIHIRLGPEGKLIGPPKVTDARRMNLPGQEFFRTAAESALRAVLKCAPYDFLPKDHYDLWRDMEIIFDPEYMLNG